MARSRLITALISPEIFPFAQTGGLANMVGSLGPALKECGAEPVYFLPRYRSVSRHGLQKATEKMEIPGLEKHGTFALWKGLGDSEIPIFFVDQPELFDRPQLYGEGGKDYPDNSMRFIYFCRAVLQALPALGRRYDILHVHDWQTALIPLFLKSLFQGHPFFQETRTLLTIHNLGYQGIYPYAEFKNSGLPDSYFSPRFLEYFGRMNLLKGGIVSADAVSTVSSTYAREILTLKFGCGMEGVLKDRQDRFYGVLNGVDHDEWDPSQGRHLPAPFSFDRLAGKETCKRALQKEMGLPKDSEAKVLGMVSRLVHQKGIDLVAEIIPTLAAEKLQWVFLGSGDPAYESLLTALAEKYPRKVAVRLAFDPPLAHRVIAGTDFLLMPSRFEPCGYNQMYSQRYGSIPIGRATGGLCDTIKDVEENAEQGTGFLFQEPTAEALREAVLKAVKFSLNSQAWKNLRRRAMQEDFSWKTSAEAYLKIYEDILQSPPSAVPKGP